MLFKKLYRPIIRKSKRMHYVLGLAVVLESVHDFGPQTAALFLSVNGKEGNFVKRFVSKPPVSDTCYNCSIHFYDDALVDSIEEELNDVLARHFSQLARVQVF
jgi:hypothetical protein